MPKKLSSKAKAPSAKPSKHAPTGATDDYKAMKKPQFSHNFRYSLTCKVEGDNFEYFVNVASKKRYVDKKARKFLTRYIEGILEKKYDKEISVHKVSIMVCRDNATGEKIPYDDL